MARADAAGGAAQPVARRANTAFPRFRSLPASLPHGRRHARSVRERTDKRIAHQFFDCRESRRMTACGAMRTENNPRRPAIEAGAAHANRPSSMKPAQLHDNDPTGESRL
ncbi:hypothetical protein [Burkholderia multivorans]|uniref:hypothetical protein n=1 Tax=Burkholderia multivorans TaxID=87883 RepID=UPI000AC45A16|nr:hypothetical protein [Burkholderia multivorans]